MHEPHLLKIKAIEESVVKTNRIFSGDVVIQSSREEHHLIPVVSFDMLH
jgi:hypothetical protein